MPDFHFHSSDSWKYSVLWAEALWLKLLSTLLSYSCDLCHFFTSVFQSMSTVRGSECRLSTKSFTLCSLKLYALCQLLTSAVKTHLQASEKLGSGREKAVSLDWISLFLMRCVLFCFVGCGGAFSPQCRRVFLQDAEHRTSKANLSRIHTVWDVPLWQLGTKRGRQRQK